jgi:hypothetical protein
MLAPQFLPLDTRSWFLFTQVTVILLSRWLWT